MKPDNDLTLVFERDDVKEALAGHCAKTHDDPDDIKDCLYCLRLIAIIASAVCEWRDICALEKSAAKPERQP